MRLRYTEFACRTLTLILWLAISYSLYFSHIATMQPQETQRTDSERRHRADEDHITTEEEPTVVTLDSTTHAAELQRSNRLLLKTGPISPRASIPVIVSQTTQKFTSSASSSIVVTPKSNLSVAPKLVTQKSISIGQNSSAPTRSIPAVPVQPTKDPMDEYSDMGGIKWSNASTVVNPHPFHYTLNPDKTCDVGSSTELFLLVYVHTRPDGIKQRELIRSTWGDVRNYDVTVRRIFVMGLPESEYVQEAVKLESNLYHDIVQEDFLDTYRNLTYKAVGALRWVKDYCSNAVYVLKTDDDVFVNMYSLLDLLVSQLKTRSFGQQQQQQQRPIICNVWYGQGVARWGKWAVSQEQRKYPTWPHFCQGLAFILTPGVAAELYNASFDVPFLWMDDVYVTGFLAKRLGIVHTEYNEHYALENHFERVLKNAAPWKHVLFSHMTNYDRRKWAWYRLEKLRSNSSTTATGS